MNRKLFISLGVVAALAAGYFLAWRMVAGEVEAGLADWAERERARGREVEIGGVDIGGFPYRIEARLRDVVYGDPTARRPWRAELAQVTANAMVWKPHHIILAFEGTHRLERVVGLDEDGAPIREAWRATADEALASVKLDLGLSKPEPRDMSLDIHGATATPEAGGPPLTAARAQLHARAREAGEGAAPVVDIAGKAEDAVLPEAPNDKLPREVALLGFEASLAPAKGGLRDLGRWARAMDEEGARLQISKLVVRWGELDIGAEGDLGLDDEARLEGHVNARVAGYQELLDGLTQSGALSGPAAAGARTSLGLMARLSGDPGGAINLPIKLKDGVVSIGPAPVGKLKPVR